MALFENKGNTVTITDIVTCVEKAKESMDRIQAFKGDYQVVTEYLMDVEKLEAVEPEEKKELERYAENVRYYERELEKCKDRDSHISSSQRITMAKYEESIPKELKELKENEEYGRLIRQDLKHLETEKGYLFYERDEIAAKQVQLKRLAQVTAALVVTLFALIAALALAMEYDMAVPYFLTALMAAGSILVIFLEANKNRKAIQVNEKKLFKAIGLLNSVKIKYVNNRNIVDFIRDKYGVKDSEELTYIYSQYRMWKEKEESYERYAARLLVENNALLKELEQIQVSDPEDWLKHTDALLDPREMVEVRHELNVRRQKLRKKIDQNMKVYKQSLLVIQKVEKLRPSYREEIQKLLEQYGIDTSMC